MNKAKITSVQGDGTWEGQHGTMYSFVVTLQAEDGTTVTAQVNAKSDTPKWMPLVGTDTPVWYQVTGEYQGAKKAKLDTQDPALGRGGRGQDPLTTKRIECSWAIQTAIATMGPITSYTEGPDAYLSQVFTLAPRFLAMRNKLMEQ